MNEICLSCRKHTKCGRAEHETIGCGYYVPMTNEEWIKQCTTEQLADVLLEHFEWGLSINAEYCFTEKYVEQNREHILEWLKQPHEGD